MDNSRPSWEQYFMNIAIEVSKRSTCDRKAVGAVAIKDKRIVCTGYNGSPPGVPHCNDVGHDLISVDGRQSCSRAVHSEVNLVYQAAKFGSSLDGTTVYVTMFPCYNCFLAMACSGIKGIIYLEEYENSVLNPRTKELAKVMNISICSLKSLLGDEIK